MGRDDTFSIIVHIKLNCSFRCACKYLLYKTQ